MTRRADRLLQIVQVLRRRKAPTTARALAAELEVAPRTIYRDIVALQAAQVPIDGEAGVGYVLRPGYDLPPLMFSADELEAVVLGVRMVFARCDPELARAAMNVLAKVEAVVPNEAQMWRATLLVPHPLPGEIDFGAHVPAIRQAIRRNVKLQIDYADETGQATTRTIWPLGLYLFSHRTLVCAWCELRADYRAFRPERITSCTALEARFDAKNGALMAEFLKNFARQADGHAGPVPPVPAGGRDGGPSPLTCSPGAFRPASTDAPRSRRR